MESSRKGNGNKIPNCQLLLLASLHLHRRGGARWLTDLAGGSLPARVGGDRRRESLSLQDASNEISLFSLLR
ncbi:hypothetical protein TanjilG_16610 [Lupinus angustifolius]|uniref:Uncharacterized protein n=1 Tax=Lupinus angustifolius TaxID=3871 RepID=A0A1J7I0Q0_LUPAN|nr:hypothetical protein TanjilG_16610 [Lupinus angustifolius]